MCKYVLICLLLPTLVHNWELSLHSNDMSLTLANDAGL